MSEKKGEEREKDGSVLDEKCCFSLFILILLSQCDEICDWVTEGGGGT